MEAEFLSAWVSVVGDGGRQATLWHLEGISSPSRADREQGHLSAGEFGPGVEGPRAGFLAPGRHSRTAITGDLNGGIEPASTKLQRPVLSTKLQRPVAGSQEDFYRVSFLRTLGTQGC